MTYDVAVWKHTGPLSDEEAIAEYERRADISEANYAAGRRQPPCAELAELFTQMRDRFPDPPWEDDPGDAADGEFVYLTMAYGRGPTSSSTSARLLAAWGSWCTTLRPRLSWADPPPNPDLSDLSHCVGQGAPSRVGTPSAD